jgi:hypothetical protein
LADVSRHARALPPGVVRLACLCVLGAGLLLAYLAARGLGDLRGQTPGFIVAYGGAFALYLGAAALALRAPDSDERQRRLALAVIWLLAIAFRLVLLPTRPTLSDDMYRYVWDGRVQAHGISPYRYPPEAKELIPLRAGDHTVWRYINRKPAVTVYPPGAQLAFAAVWRVVGNNVTGFKAALVLAELAGGAALLGLLRALRQPPERVLLYLWSPLLVFEVAHAGHVDGLMLPLLILAFWARMKERPGLLGVALGAATLVKLFPGLLLPALLPLGIVGGWRERARPAAQMLAAFGATLALGYAPYALQAGGAVGFLPHYLSENFNMGLARGLFALARRAGWPEAVLANAVTFGGMALLSALFLLRPAATGRAALGRCLWLIGWFTLWTQNLFPWYLLWLLPLLAAFVAPGRWLGFAATPPTAWLIFTGSVALAYLFFIRWRVMLAGQAAEFAPLYVLLGVNALAAAREALARAAGRASARRMRLEDAAPIS